MTIPAIREEDLACLTGVFPNLDFADDECRAVLLENGTVDVQAAPGSGKTTILAARLYLLSRQWTAERQGICVISHTNTAANEIRQRLSGTAEGTRLLGHPHFIGTIHGFVNQYLALPWFRSTGAAVDCIDDDVFARRAIQEAKRNPSVRYWLEHNPRQAPAIVRGLRLTGDSLDVTSSGGAVPKSEKVGSALETLKRKLCSQGLFRYEDMFALAEHALTTVPRLSDLLAHRFPLVLIDEMQDTSPSQAALLDRAFGGNVVLQRFGDINQRIFDGDEDGEVPFPVGNTLPMSASRRFGPVIASIVSSVQQAGAPVIGKGPESDIPPTLLVYTTDTIDQVIPRFGRLVLDSFDDTALASGGHVRAICARRSGEAKQEPGRHVGDFWPPLAVDTSAASPRQANAWAMLGDDPDMGVLPTELGSRFERVRRIVLLALRQAKAPVAESVQEPWRLFRALREQDFDLAPLRLVCLGLVTDPTAGGTDEKRAQAIITLHAVLESLLPGTSLADFAKLDVFAEQNGLDGQSPKTLSRACAVSVNGREVSVTVDTVGMTKGETHLATLFLESFGRSTRFDVPEALGLITGRLGATRKLPKTVPPQLRYVYVGLSRPTRLLCVAVNKSRLLDEDAVSLRQAGWHVLNVDSAV